MPIAGARLLEQPRRSASRSACAAGRAPASCRASYPRRAGRGRTDSRYCSASCMPLHRFVDGASAAERAPTCCCIASTVSSNRVEIGLVRRRGRPAAARSRGWRRSRAAAARARASSARAAASSASTLARSHRRFEIALDALPERRIARQAARVGARGLVAATVLRRRAIAARLAATGRTLRLSPASDRVASARAACVTAISSPSPPSLTVVVPLPLHQTEPAAASNATASSDAERRQQLRPGARFVSWPRSRLAVSPAVRNSGSSSSFSRLNRGQTSEPRR